MQSNLDRVPPKILKKLEKLHALANCPTGNPNETAAAAARMTEILLEYGLENINFSKVRFASEQVTSKTLTTWEEHLLANMGDCAGCRVGFRNKEPWIVGDPDIIQGVIYQWNVVVNEIQRLFKVAYPTEKKKSKTHGSFCRGASIRVVERIRAKKAAMIYDLKMKARQHAASGTDVIGALVWIEGGINDLDFVKALGGNPEQSPQKPPDREKDFGDTKPQHFTAFKRGLIAGNTIPLDSEASHELAAGKKEIDGR